MPGEGEARKPLCADIDGFSLHAAVRVDAHEPAGVHAAAGGVSAAGQLRPEVRRDRGAAPPPQP